MMISPEGYVSQFEGRPYEELAAARESLLADLREQEAAFRAGQLGPGVILCPSPGVVYATTLEYLAALCTYMAHHAQGFTGESDLFACDEGGGQDDE